MIAGFTHYWRNCLKMRRFSVYARIIKLHTSCFKNLFLKVSNFCKIISKLIWIHCASVTCLVRIINKDNNHIGSRFLDNYDVTILKCDKSACATFIQYVYRYLVLQYDSFCSTFEAVMSILSNPYIQYLSKITSRKKLPLFKISSVAIV